MVFPLRVVYRAHESSTLFLSSMSKVSAPAELYTQIKPLPIADTTRPFLFTNRNLGAKSNVSEFLCASPAYPAPTYVPVTICGAPDGKMLAMSASKLDTPVPPRAGDMIPLVIWSAECVWEVGAAPICAAVTPCGLLLLLIWLVRLAWTAAALPEGSAPTWAAVTLWGLLLSAAWASRLSCTAAALPDGSAPTS